MQTSSPAVDLNGAMRPTAIRIESALAKFSAMLVDDHGFTQEEADRIRTVYLREKILKIDPIGGGFSLIHGAFLEADVLRRAARVEK